MQAWHPTAAAGPARARSTTRSATSSSGIWFAGDTDLDPAMEELRGRVDVALLPIWGWGPSLGPGPPRPDARPRARRRSSRRRSSIPIHWGTFLPLGTRWRHGAVLSEPAQAFAAQVARAGAGVRVATLAVGER